MINNEIELVKYLKINFKKYFSSCHLIGFNLPMKGCISKRYIGQVDLIFTKGKSKYAVEIKFDTYKCSGDFWESLKILGYTKNMELSGCKNVKPVIMVRKDLISYDFLPILYCLGVSYILFELKNDELELEFNFFDRFKNHVDIKHSKMAEMAFTACQSNLMERGI